MLLLPFLLQSISPTTCPAIAVNPELLPILTNLVKTSLFRYFKVNLHKPCLFWNEELLCTMEGCEVVPAGIDEIKTITDNAETKQETTKQTLRQNNFLKDFGTVDYSPTLLLREEKKCVLDEDDYCHLEDEDDQEGIFINLLKNQERYTGYAGESAARVWSSIYNENCFGGSRFTVNN